MSERLLDRGVEDDPRAQSDSESPPSAVRWIAIAVASLLILALVVLHLTGAIGPGVH